MSFEYLNTHVLDSDYARCLRTSASFEAEVETEFKRGNITSTESANLLAKAKSTFFFPDVRCQPILLAPLMHNIKNQRRTYTRQQLMDEALDMQKRGRLTPDQMSTVLEEMKKRSYRDEPWLSSADDDEWDKELGSDMDTYSFIQKKVAQAIIDNDQKTIEALRKKGWGFGNVDDLGILILPNGKSLNMLQFGPCAESFTKLYKYMDAIHTKK